MFKGKYDERNNIIRLYIYLSLELDASTHSSTKEKTLYMVLLKYWTHFNAIVYPSYTYNIPTISVDFKVTNIKTPMVWVEVSFKCYIVDFLRGKIFRFDNFIYYIARLVFSFVTRAYPFSYNNNILPFFGLLIYVFLSTDILLPNFYFSFPSHYLSLDLGNTNPPR